MYLLRKVDRKETVAGIPDSLSTRRAGFFVETKPFFKTPLMKFLAAATNSNIGIVGEQGFQTYIAGGKIGSVSFLFTLIFQNSSLIVYVGTTGEIN